MNRPLWVAILIVLVGVSGAGCGSKPAATGDSTTAATGSNNPAGTKINGATVVNQPPADGSVPAGGIVLKPKNPDDPKFKQDPKLAGGGGN
jgi:hypothetical protein